MLTLDRDHEVAHDMHALFDGVASTRNAAGGARAAAGTPPRRPLGGRWLFAIAPLVVALLAGGAVLHRDILASVEQFTGTRVAVPPVAPAPVRVAPVGAAAVRAAPVGAHEAAARATSAATAPSAASVVPHRSVPVAAAIATGAARRTPTATAARTADRDDMAPVTVPAVPVQTGCADRDPRDACIYRDVVAADRRLRAAYDDAVDAGVPARSLASVARAWRDARALAEDYPDETIRRYAALARELGELRPLDGR